MELTNRYKRLPLASIIVRRDTRQRREVDPTDLLESIRQYGVINPIIVTKELVLVAGERRLAGSKLLQLPDIPARFIDELSETEAQIIELEENLKRSDLPWRDIVNAVGRLHALYTSSNAEWSQAETAARLSLSQQYMSVIARLFRDIDSPKIALAKSMPEAINILVRIDDRRIADALSDIMETGAEVFDSPPATAETVASNGAENPLPPVAGSSYNAVSGSPGTPVPMPPESIVGADFTVWVQSYSGPKFNLVHCDFPYGINVFKGEMSGRDRHDTYSDSPDTYWNLIKCFCTHLDKFMSASAHLMFWCAGDIEIQFKTLQAFRQLAPSLEFSNYPLIWHKTDNVGLLPDPKRGPRRVYESCLIASREDRIIVKAKSNVYGAPTDKAHHPSTKPEPVLRYFMEMFVDEHTRCFDPTCGGGSALRAAESLGATSVLGLELDAEHVSSAKSALRSFRALRRATANVG